MGRVIRRDDGARRIPGAVVSAREEAERILAAARAEARAHVERARADAARIASEARAEGREAGVAEVAALRLAAAALAARAREDARADVEALGLEAGRRLLESSLAEDADRVVPIVASALERARRARRAIVRVNPADAESLARWLEHGPGGAMPVQAIEIEADPAIARGGCVVVTDVGRVDARLEVRLGALEAALRATSWGAGPR